MSSPSSAVAGAPSVSGYRPDIDGLRAVAVLAVVAFHAFPSVLAGGFAGVDVFFVISGFLIGGILLDARAAGTFTYRAFYARRIRRLFPALLLVLVFTLVAGHFVLLPNEYRTLGRHVVAGAGFAANLAFLREAGYFDVASTLKPLLHLWSLGVEEQFYIVCPLLLAALSRSRWAVPSAVVAVALLSFVVAHALLQVLPAQAFFHPAARFWELLAGVWLAAWQRRPGAVPPAAVAGMAVTAGLALLATGFVVLQEASAFPGWQALLPVTGALLIVAYGARSRVARWLLASRPLVFVGLVSYPLYLWHWPLLSLARIRADGEPGIAVRVALVVLAFLLAWATWRWVETPVRHARPGTPVTRGLLAGMVLVALGGTAVWYSHGMAGYPPAVRAIIDYEYDMEAAAREDDCFLGEVGTGRVAFAAACTAPARAGGKPVVVLWGDSHAAHLYPGLQARADGNPGFALVQLTAGACPPLAGPHPGLRRRCADINALARAEIARLRPEIVVLGGHWYQYLAAGGRGTLDVAALRDTITQLRTLGVRQVIVVGQVPVWRTGQPSVILRLWQERRQIVDRTDYQLDPAALALDAQLQVDLAGSGADYVSPVSLFCEQGACLTFADAGRTEPVAYDYGHLTPGGSRRVATAIHRLFSPDERAPDER